MSLLFDLGFDEAIEFLKKIHTKLSDEKVLNKNEKQQWEVLTGFDNSWIDAGVVEIYIKGMQKAKEILDKQRIRKNTQ